MNLAFASIEEIGRLYRLGTVSPTEVTQLCLDRIRRYDHSLKAFITITDDLAIAAAQRAERELAQGIDRGPLHGIPLALKDLIDTKGIRTTAGSRVLIDNVPPRDAPLWTSLLDAGAVLVGKTNMQEFADGIPHPDFGQTRNPWDVRRTAGGSSGGSAAAVVAGFCYGAIGSDTGGSIRVPASYCGAVGMKPTYGLVSTAGVFPLSWSLDHVGPIARNSRDAGLILCGMTGLEPAPHITAKGLRLGVIVEHAVGPELTEDAMSAFEVACQLMQERGIEMVPIQVQDLGRSEGILPTIIGPEAAVAHQSLLETRPEDYAEDTRQQLEFGFAVSGVHYVRAQQFRRYLAEQFVSALRDIDALVNPTVAWTAPEEDPHIMSSQGEFEGRRTVPYNLIGFPALSIPSGFGRDGLPLGLQIATLPNTDRRLIEIGSALESIGIGEPRGVPGWLDS